MRFAEPYWQWWQGIMGEDGPRQDHAHPAASAQERAAVQHVKFVAYQLTKALSPRHHKRRQKRRRR